MMHKVFGTRENVEYLDRKGIYLIPINGSKIGIIKTPRGNFFLGGGVDDGETDEMCIARECLEETGYTVLIKEKVCTAETYAHHPEIGYFHPIQTYYTGELVEKKQEPIEEDHELVWMSYSDLKGKMHVEMQNWALDECFNLLQNRNGE